MNWLWISLWTYLVFVLHSALAHELMIAGCMPQFVLAGLLLMTIRIGGRQGVLLAGGWGLLSDSLTDGQMGADVACFACLVFLVQRLNVRWNLSSPWRLGAISVVVVGIAVVASTSSRLLLGGQSPQFPIILAKAAGSGFYTGIVVVVAAFAVQIVLRQPAGPAGGDAPLVSNKWRMLTE